MKYYFTPDVWVVMATLLTLFLVWIMWRSIFSSKWYFVAVVIMASIILFYYFIKIPVSVYVDQEKIKINQIIGTIIFTKENVRVLPLERNDLDNVVRTFGNGGIGGYVGWFSSPRLGKFYMLAVNRKELAKIITDTGKVYVINYPINLLGKN